MVKRTMQIAKIYFIAFLLLLSTFAIGVGKVQVIIDSKIPMVYEKIDLSAD